MIRASLIALFSTLMLCGFCEKEFVSLGRHTWRCKDRIDFNQQSKENVVPAIEILS
jgi:tRNA(Ile2) C34 agmatinyltransferase TiaS